MNNRKSKAQAILFAFDLKLSSGILGYKYNRWGDTTSSVGGWSGSAKDAEEKNWKPNLELLWATVNYAISKGRLDNRGPED